ncbi:SDR family oxidoreductase [Rhizobium sp. XQZ8]|uniref:SDR family NAD(P)-dependent oxidoreductase n=1 Tax=Rhizobium populisoli TaxID=2859785 RepID=UPI001C6798B6|nr:SDR family oxidoreductase [Rhizobium populisoli]MBW6422882.1 SDR family oxidoreductase [Rhizobium populisoli]
MERTQYPSLAGRTVIITGGASGIGEAIVRAFAHNGSKVAFLDLQKDVGEKLAAELSAGGATVKFVQCDLTDIAALRAAFVEIKAAFGPAAVLVNNAANDRRFEFLDVEVDDFDWMMAVNLRHVFFACQAVIPQMRELGQGAIINMTSGAWVRGVPGLQAYTAAKAAIVGFSNSMARQYGSERIRVNALAPGMVITPRQRELWYQDESKIAEGLKVQSIPEEISMDDVANACLFFASDDSRMITKQMLLVNGGII